MFKINNKPLVRFLVALLLPAFVVACGKAGPPIKPSEAAANRAIENNEEPPEPPKRDRRIFLDNLLE